MSKPPTARRPARLLPSLCAAVLASACSRPHAPDSRGTSPSPSLPSLTGIWASEGYGYQFEILPNGDLARSQLTSVSCIPTWHAHLVRQSADSMTYQRTDSPALFVLRPRSADQITIHPTDTTADIVCHRLPVRLPLCDRPTPDTPLSNFDVFAATFAEQYPFFAEHGVDWGKVVAGARGKVTDTTKPLELYMLLKGMLEPLQDAHTTLFAPTIEAPDGGAGEGQGYAGFRMAPGVVDPDDWGRVRGLVDHYLARPLRPYCEKRLEVPLYTAADLAAGRDPALEVAIQHLRRR